jgi:hypothetical protein
MVVSDNDHSKIVFFNQTNNSVYSYPAVPNSTLWIETLVIGANNLRDESGGTFVTIDECGRFWFSLETSVVQIFDSLGS